MEFYSRLLSSNQMYMWSPSLVDMEKWQNYADSAKTTAFLSMRASCRTDWMRMVSLIRLTGPQALQIWTHWTYHIWAPCWKSAINSSRSTRQLMSWKSLCRHTIWEEMPREYVNKVVAIFTKCLWLPTWLWLPKVVTPSICSNSVRLQVCILISSPTNWLFS